MITVRFPSGHAVQYNNANYIEWGQTMHRLLTAQGGSLVALVGISNDLLIEFCQPCRVYDGTQANANEALAEIQKELRANKRRLPSKKGQR